MQTTYTAYVDGQRMSVKHDWFVAKEDIVIIFDMLSQRHTFARSARVALFAAIADVKPGQSFSLETLMDGRAIVFELTVSAAHVVRERPMANPFAGLPV